MVTERVTLAVVCAIMLGLFAVAIVTEPPADPEVIDVCPEYALGGVADCPVRP